MLALAKKSPMTIANNAAKAAEGLSPGLNDAKLRQFLDVSLPRRGYRTQPRVSTLGFNP
jgi:hypothetical protein